MDDLMDNVQMKIGKAHLGFGIKRKSVSLTETLFI